MQLVQSKQEFGLLLACQNSLFDDQVIDLAFIQHTGDVHIELLLFA